MAKCSSDETPPNIECAKCAAEVKVACMGDHSCAGHVAMDVRRKANLLPPYERSGRTPSNERIGFITSGTCSQTSQLPKRNHSTSSWAELHQNGPQSQRNASCQKAQSSNTAKHPYFNKESLSFWHNSKGSKTASAKLGDDPVSALNCSVLSIVSQLRSRRTSASAFRQSLTPAFRLDPVPLEPLMASGRYLGPNMMILDSDYLRKSESSKILQSQPHVDQRCQDVYSGRHSHVEADIRRSLKSFRTGELRVPSLGTKCHQRPTNATAWRKKTEISSEQVLQLAVEPRALSSNQDERKVNFLGPICKLTIPYQLGTTRIVRSPKECRGCGKFISGKYIKSADGRLSGSWHRECFRCHTCREILQTTDIYYLNDWPYCMQHYHDLNKSLCSRCDAGIEGRFFEVASRRRFHPQCFACHYCNQPFTNVYFERDTGFYCEADALRSWQTK